MYDPKTLRRGDAEKNPLSPRYVITVSMYHRISVSVPEEL
jgi:hypothetical protein